MDILQRLQNKNKSVSSEYDPDILIDMHHAMMKEYGWIPFEEFKSLPLPVFWNLVQCIQRDREAEKREYDKANKRR